MTNHANGGRLSALLARKAARSFIAIAENGRPWSISDAQRCLPLGWRLGEGFLTGRDQPMTIDTLTNAFRQFASKI